MTPLKVADDGVPGRLGGGSHGAHGFARPRRNLVRAPAAGGPGRGSYAEVVALPKLVVKCTTVDPEPCSQAFTVAVTALAAGAQVSLWLTGDASWLAAPGRAESITLPQATPLADLRDAVLAEGRLTVCTQCAARRSITQQDLLPGVRIAGAASFVEEILGDATQALVYGAGASGT